MDAEMPGIRVTAQGASDAELAAIAAAVEALWPNPQEELMVPLPPPPWRFSGRWWHGRDRSRHGP